MENERYIACIIIAHGAFLTLINETYDETYPEIGFRFKNKGGIRFTNERGTRIAHQRGTKFSNEN